jgi:putative copper export protein
MRAVIYRYVLLLHILSATIWTGGHLVLAFRYLPRALRLRSAAIIRSFEAPFESIGIPALVIQLLTGVWMAYQLIPDVGRWFALDNPSSQMITLKVALLVLTVAFAIDARLRVIPQLTDERVGTIAPHIIAVTTMGVLFVAAGVGIRTGGMF